MRLMFHVELTPGLFLGGALCSPALAAPPAPVMPGHREPCHQHRRLGQNSRLVLWPVVASGRREEAAVLSQEETAETLCVPGCLQHPDEAALVTSQQPPEQDLP